MMILTTATTNRPFPLASLYSTMQIPYTLGTSIVKRQGWKKKVIFFLKLDEILDHPRALHTTISQFYNLIQINITCQIKSCLKPVQY